MNRRITLGTLIIACVLYVGSTQLCGQNSSMPKFTDLAPKDMVLLDRQRAVVSATVKQRYGAALTRTKKDLPILQKLIDESVFAKSQTYELQSLGVAFGDVMASALPLHWVMITDEYGTDPTLRYKNTTLNVNVLTIISQRIERNERVSLSELLRMTSQQLAAYDKNR